MLQRIHQLVVRDIRIWKNEHVFDFAEGITVINGANGRGKSTLALALMLTLCSSARSPKLKQHLTPVSGGAPKSSVTFTADDTRYTITKVWGDIDQSVLMDTDADEELARGGEAEDRVSELAFDINPQTGNYSTKEGPFGNLSKRITGNLPSLMFHHQGELHHALEMGEQLRNIGLSVAKADLALALLSVTEGAENERRMFVSSLKSNGRPTANASGALVTAMIELSDLEGRLEVATDLSQQLMTKQERLSELRANTLTDEDRIEKRKHVKHFRFQAEAHRKDREDARAKFDAEQAAHTPLDEHQKERLKLVSNEQEKVKDEVTAHTKLQTANLSLGETQQSHLDASTRLTTLKHDSSNVEAWFQYERRIARLVQDKADLAKAKERQQERQDKEVEIRKVQDAIAKIRLATPEQWGNLRGIEAQQKALRMNQNMTVTVHGLRKGLTVHTDGTPIEGSGTASEFVEVKDGKDLLIDIRTSIKEGASIEQLTQEAKKILTGLEAESRKELKQRQTEADGLNGAIQTLDAQLSALPKTAELETLIHELRARVEGEGGEPETARPEGDLGELKVRLEERLDEATRAEGASDASSREAATSAAASSALFVKAEEEATQAKQRLEDHRESYGLDNAVVEAEITARSNMESAKEVHASFEAAKPEQEDSPATQARTLEERLEELDRHRDGLIRLEESVKALRDNALLGDLSGLEAEVEARRRKMAELQIDHDAFNLLSRVAKEQQAAAQGQSRSEISQEIDRLLNYVWGGEPSTALDDDGAPTSISNISVEDESHGSREQLLTIMRMVLLKKVAPKGATMLLDDALVFADSGRLKRMKDVIQSHANKDVSNGMQMIVFSCRKGDYDSVANKIVDLDMEV